MAKRSVFLIVAFTFILCAMISGRADAFGHCARCSSGCYGYAGYYGGAGNCGLGWGNCGAAWWFGYGVYGVPKGRRLWQSLWLRLLRRPLPSPVRQVRP